MARSSWLSRLFARARRHNTARPRTRSRWSPPPLRLEILEDRLAPATFQEAGNQLRLALAAGEQVSVVANSNDTYSLTLGTGTWSGTDTAKAVGSGAATLT